VAAVATLAGLRPGRGRPGAAPAASPARPSARSARVRPGGVDWWCRGRRSRPLGTPRGVTPEGHRRSDARDGPSLPRMSSHGNIWQAISHRQPAGAAASARHRPVPAERPVERNGPTPATASAIPGRAPARPSRPHPPWPGRNVRASSSDARPLVTSLPRDDRTCSARAARAWYEVSLHNTCERSSGPMGLGAYKRRDRQPTGIRCRRYDRGAASGGWRQDWMRRLGCDASA
jgi:hypothetical protein